MKPRRKNLKKEKQASLPPNDTNTPLPIPLHIATYIKEWERKGQLDEKNLFLATWPLVVHTNVPPMKQYLKSQFYEDILDQMPEAMMMDSLQCLSYEGNFLSLDNVDKCSDEQCAFMVNLYNTYYLTACDEEDDDKNWHCLYLATYLTRRFPTSEVYLALDPILGPQRPAVDRQKEALTLVADLLRQHPKVPKEILLPNMAAWYDLNHLYEPSHTYLQLLSRFADKYGLDRQVLLAYDKDIRARKEKPELGLKLANGREYMICALPLDHRYRKIICFQVGTLCALPECRVYHSSESKLLQKCGACKTVYYCSHQHQKKDWKRHKPLCIAK